MKFFRSCSTVTVYKTFDCKVLLKFSKAGNSLETVSFTFFNRGLLQKLDDDKIILRQSKYMELYM